MSIEEAAIRVVENLLDRPAGPMAFRFVIQPLMATAIATRDGIRDGRTGAPPYFLTILIPSELQGAALKEGIRATGRIMLFALLLDAIYQLFFLHAFYLGEALFVAILLGFLPYTVFRGPISRIVRHWHRNRDGSEQDRE